MTESRSVSFAAACIAALTLTPAAEAWVYLYGPQDALDQANRRVAAVTQCFGGGYVAVGTTGLGDGPNPDVYVVRTSDSGARIWESILDVNSGRRLINEGIAIAEVKRGFVVLSNTLEDGVWYPALTRIDCWGRPDWTRIYPDFNGNWLLGKDLIKMRSGDLAVAGIFGHGEDEDGWLMRTDADGNIRWNYNYRLVGSQAFHALTETGMPTEPSGDLVAVGRYRLGEGRTRGFVARVRGVDGDHGLPPGCVTSHGFLDEDAVYNSVIQLTSGGLAGSFAMTGTITNGDGRGDIWAVRADPCTLLAQSRIGEANGYASEEGFDLREVLVPSPGIPVGSLAIAGASTPPPGGTDAALVFVSPAAPMALLGARLFGDAELGTEAFHSLGTRGSGFILAGVTSRDWQVLGDPLDLYLVHFDPQDPECAAAWYPWVVESAAGPAGLAPRRRIPAVAREVSTAWREDATGFPECPRKDPSQ